MGQLALRDYPELPVALTTKEHDLLYQCEQTISDGLDTFYAVGHALATVNQHKLYRAEYRTFEAYCREKWQMGKAQAYRLIDADQVRENLSPIGDDIDLPKKESHIRALKQAPAEMQADIWQGVQMSGEPVTATRIEEAVQKAVPQPEREESTETRVVIDDPSDLEPYIVTWLQEETQYNQKASNILLHELIYSTNIVGDTPMKRMMRYLQTEQHLNILPKVRVRDACENLEGKLGHYYKLVDTCIQCHKRYPKQLMDDEMGNVCHACAQTYREQCQKIEEAHKRLEIDEDAEQHDTLTCEFCGEKYSTDNLYHGNLYVETSVNADIYAAVICRTCARKAIDEERDDNRPLELDSLARNRIVWAGFRIFRASKHEKCLKIYSPGDPSPYASGELITWGSWRKYEQFKTQKALKERQQELEQEDDVIFDTKI